MIGFFLLLKEVPAILLLVLSNLPTIIRICSEAQKRIDEAEVDKKVADDLKAIEKAFREKDTEALKKIFNS